MNGVLSIIIIINIIFQKFTKFKKCLFEENLKLF